MSIEDKCQHETCILIQERGEQYLVCLRDSHAFQMNNEYEQRPNTSIEIHTPIKGVYYYKRHKVYTKKKRRKEE